MGNFIFGDLSLGRITLMLKAHKVFLYLEFWWHKPSSLLLVEEWRASASLPMCQKRPWEAGSSRHSLLAEYVCARWLWGGWVPCREDFSPPFAACQRHWLLPGETAFPRVWQPSICFPSHQTGWHFTEKMLLNSTAVLGWYIQSMPRHCCLLVCCSLMNKILSSCSLKLLLLLDKVLEEGMDYTYSRNFRMGGVLCFWREIISMTLWNLVLFNCYLQDSENKILS